ncbi:transposase [Methanosarcina barkeri CM1]|uniref:Transposase n=1 Tax=Methanosarcina barkeri CM1 TaxID=796385 RepID=A0A0G3CE01_METBA|nr:transposase [Methanosarcina barkeri CM1]
MIKITAGVCYPICEKTFEIPLNVKEPWQITNAEFDLTSEKLNIWIDFKRGSKFPCPKCGKPNCSAYDTKEKVLRHINYFQYSTYLHCRIPRIECENCGVLQIKVPWAREKSNFTLRMEALILELSKRMPVLQIGKLLGEYDKKLWRVINHYTDNARSKEDLSDVCVVGIDETSCKKGHEYITLVVDIKDSKVIFACEGKDSSTITSFSKDLQDHNGNKSNIKSVCCDMSPSYISGISIEFPDAKITFDKFHVMKAMNEGLNEVRIQEQKKQRNSKIPNSYGLRTRKI